MRRLKGYCKSKHTLVFPRDINCHYENVPILALVTLVTLLIIVLKYRLSPIDKK